MNALQRKRLLKIASHLRGGKLGHKKFDFAVINADENRNELHHNGCGTLGCAIGEFPFIFPRQFEFRNGEPLPRDAAFRRRVLRYLDPVFSAAEEFLGISEEESVHLFAPWGQKNYKYGGCILGANATARAVAANIEAFVKRKAKAQ